MASEVIILSIGELIRNRRIELKLTLEEVGDMVGVSKSTVKKWEDGYISNMKRDKIALLAHALQIQPVSLITGELIPTSFENESSFILSEHEKRLISAYRDKPEMQPAVDKLLGIDSAPAKNIGEDIAETVIKTQNTLNTKCNSNSK